MSTRDTWVATKTPLPVSSDFGTSKNRRTWHSLGFHWETPQTGPLQTETFQPALDTAVCKDRKAGRRKKDPPGTKASATETE
ncbi:hypothetical protein EYF80_049396 [Liparis tanakae]|uniref:Uncharacterized protein n=1 Tax=Liparis tanakae TaxID=230148 RepID=A0A4Z2FJH5_9TELE|nr:hypothetical protein EYF80_049396 [Liparis tanakae]